MCSSCDGNEYREVIAENVRAARKQEGYEGRYDRQPDLQAELAEVYKLRTECQAAGHVKGNLTYDAAANIMVCGNCAEIIDMNELVHPALRVPHVKQVRASDKNTLLLLDALRGQF